MTACALAGLPAMLHAESMVTASAERCTFRSGQTAALKGPAIDCDSWSVAASMHCRTTLGGPLLFSIEVLTSHSPGLRDSCSTASADGAAPIVARTTAAPHSRMKFSHIRYPLGDYHNNGKGSQAIGTTLRRVKPFRARSLPGRIFPRAT